MSWKPGTEASDAVEIVLAQGRKVRCVRGSTGRRVGHRHAIGLAAMKFAFHVPTYRQQDWFAQCGWFPSRSTVNDLLNYAVETIEPLYRQMWLSAAFAADPAGRRYDAVCAVA